MGGYNLSYFHHLAEVGGNVCVRKPVCAGAKSKKEPGNKMALGVPENKSLSEIQCCSTYSFV